MNRRAFLTRTLGVVAGAALAPLLPTPSVSPTLAVFDTKDVGFTTLAYKGIPLVWDEACQSSRIYMINPRWSG